MTADSARRPASVAPVAGGVPAPLGPGGGVASAATPSMKLGSTGVVHTSATSRRGPRGRSARACPARRSGRLPLDRGGDGSLGAGDGQERVRQQRQGDMPIPAWPAADLIVVQADLAFGALEALLDGLITNGKFCCTRRVRLHLTWWHRPLRLRRSGLETAVVPVGAPHDPDLDCLPPDQPPPRRGPPLGSGLPAAGALDGGTMRHHRAGGADHPGGA
jgi:hypothetical protein